MSIKHSHNLSDRLVFLITPYNLPLLFNYRTKMCHLIAKTEYKWLIRVLRLVERLAMFPVYKHLYGDLFSRCKSHFPGENKLLCNHQPDISLDLQTDL
jgi:hypothetical protein